MSIGFWTGIFIFAVKNFISYQKGYAQCAKLKLEWGGHPPFGCDLNWGFPIEHHSWQLLFNFLIAVVCSFALGLLFHIISEKINSR